MMDFWAALLAASASLAVACTGDGGRQASGNTRDRGAIAFPVSVAPIATRDARFRISAVGSVEAFEQVEVTARVPGVVERVDFSEGTRVERGTRLAVIDPERYQIALEASRSAHARAEAERKNAEIAAKRREDANTKSPGIVRNEDIDQARLKLDVARAQEAEALASLRLAELNLREAFVRAPVGGVIDTRAVSTGQYVQPGARLATIVRREPLLLRFDVAEGEAGRLVPGTLATFRVQDSSDQFEARITHVADVANATTRMVRVTAEIVEVGEGRRLPRPGSFAEVSVEIGGERVVPVVAETAIRPTEHGFLAFVVEGEVVRPRILELGPRTIDGYFEVRSGLSIGEVIVVRGAEALRDGAKIRIVNGGEESGQKP